MVRPAAMLGHSVSEYLAAPRLREFVIHLTESRRNSARSPPHPLHRVRLCRGPIPDCDPTCVHPKGGSNPNRNYNPPGLHHSHPDGSDSRCHGCDARRDGCDVRGEGSDSPPVRSAALRNSCNALRNSGGRRGARCVPRHGIVLVDSDGSERRQIRSAAREERGAW